MSFVTSDEHYAYFHEGSHMVFPNTHKLHFVKKYDYSLILNYHMKLCELIKGGED